MKVLILFLFITSLRFAAAGDTERSIQDSRLQSLIWLGNSSAARPSPIESARQFSNQFFPKSGEAIPIARILAATAGLEKTQSKRKANLAKWCAKLGPAISLTKIDGGISQISEDQFFAQFRTTASFRAEKCLLVVEVVGDHNSWKLVGFHPNHFDYE